MTAHYMIIEGAARASGERLSVGAPGEAGRRGPGLRRTDGVDQWKAAAGREALLAWFQDERRFLDCLHPGPTVRERVRMQPMLRWKAQNVREHCGRM